VHNGPTPALSSTATTSDVPTIAVLGRLVPHKRVELLLEAAAQLSSVLPDLRIEVAGDGYWLDQIRAAIVSLGLQGRVKVLGHISEQDKADLLERAWVHAVPSLKEGWGLAVMEAGSHGTPSIAFRHAGGLAESMLALLADAPRRQRLGAHARTHAARFTWSTTAERFADVLDHPST
jgi:glycosyltransferase involved in cell wall biosynthesis